MSLENHDYAISYILGLSHVLNIAFAKVLSSSGENKDLLSNLSSTTFKDQLDVAKRVTDENPHLYYEIQYLNKFSLKTISELSNAIKEIFDFLNFWPKVKILNQKWFLSKARAKIIMLDPVRPVGSSE